MKSHSGPTERKKKAISMNKREQTESDLHALRLDERRLTWVVSQADSIGKEDLAQRLGWSSSKLNACLASIKRKGVLSVSTLPKDGTGRKPISFAIEAEMGCFLGIHCDLASDCLVLLDASGRRIKEMEYPALSWNEEDGQQFIDTLDEFLGKEFRNSLLAAGISSAIHFNKPGSAALRGPSFTNDSALLLAQAVEKRFGVPVSVGRPQVLMCYQGDLRGLVFRKESFINVIVTDHLGIAVIVNGERWLGQSGLSGDLGHLKIIGNERACYCGANGCLRTKVTYAGVCQEARERLQNLERGGVHQNLDPSDFEGPPYLPGVEKLVESANRHEAFATGILYDTATDLGTALASVVSLFNPARLFVHSVLTEARDLFSEQVRFMIRKNCLELYSRHLNIEFRTYSLVTNATGAAALSRDGYFNEIFDVG